MNALDAILTAVAAAALLVPAAPLRAQTAAASDFGHVKGSPDAPIEIIEFADFACAACGQFARETLPHIVRDWIDTGRARLRFVPFNLSFFRPGAGAAHAAECAAEQDAFWPMHDLLYARQDEWLGRGSQRERFEGYATDLGLDAETFTACLTAEATRGTIDANTARAREHEVRATPTFIIRGRRIQGALSLQAFTAVLTGS